MLMYAIVALAVAALGGLGFFAYMKLVKAGVLRYNKWDRRERGSLKVGAQVPDLPITMFDGTTTRLSEIWRTKPVFLIFGSCT